MLDAIAKPFGLLLLWLYNLVGNYGIAVFLFALIVKLIMLPFQYKSQKGMMRMQALNPQIQELQKRHEGNQQRLQQEISKLYKEEKVNPMSGCLWMLIPYPVLLALYRAIRFPLTTMMGVPAELLQEGGAIYQKLSELGFDFSGNAVYIQLRQSEFITAHFSDFQSLSEKLVDIDYSFLGLNLADTPRLTFWTNGITWASIGLFLVPIVSALLSWLQMKLGQTRTANADNEAAQKTQQSMQTMNLMMPLLSLWIGFSMPAALGFYWVFNSMLYIVQSLVFNKHFAKVMAEENAVREARQREREAELERKRAETERLRAEGQQKENTNTSKKKQQARQKAELDELRAAAIRDERAAKRARKGIVDVAEEKPASQVGNRRYARGRAYVPDRFTNPEHAAEATAAAAAESEGAEPIDESVAEAVTPSENSVPDTASGEEVSAFTLDEEKDTADAEEEPEEPEEPETDEESEDSDELEESDEPEDGEDDDK